MADKLIGMKEALEILREKQYVSELGFRNWLRSPDSTPFVKPILEPHGIHKWRKFKRSEINRVRDLLPENRINGQPLFPRKPK